MRRLFHIVFDALSVLSLALALAVAVFWIRSSRHADFVRVLLTPPQLVPFADDAQAAAWAKLKAQHGWAGRSNARVAGAASMNGSLLIEWGRESEMVADRAIAPSRVRYGSNGQEFFVTDSTMLSMAGLAQGTRLLGFEIRALNLGPDNQTRTLVVPMAAVLIAFLLLPITRVGLWWRKRRRRKTHHCTTCGYDLRATPEKCPECGAAAVPNIS